MLALQPVFFWLGAIGFITALIGGYPIFKEAVSSLTERRMTMELSMTIAICAALAIAKINPLLAAFIHVTSELAFILNSARLLPGAIAPDQDSDSRRRAASA
jgi:cation transport ATPase